ncbi:MAG: ABC transporter permease [Acidobacteriia bacterium]|nr:ABC transporter permease [Terriglobia bacterium]
MPDQESDNKPQQKPSHKGNQQEATKQQIRDEQELTRTSLLGIFSAYVLIVGTVVGFGVLAYYTGHKITQEIIFYISIPLLLAIPIALICYWLASVFKSTRTKILLDRLAESAFVAFLARHREVFGWFQYALSAWEIGDAIRKFPMHPRFSLTVIVYFGAWAVGAAISNAELKITRQQREVEDTLWESIDRDHEVFDKMSAVIKGLQDTVVALADEIGSKKQPSESPSEGRKEPENGA